MGKIKAVLFDLGNVLVDIDLNMFWRMLEFDSPAAIAPYAQDLKQWAMRYEAGEFPTDHFLLGLQRILGSGYSMPALRKAFQSIICQPIAGMEELVADVSRRYRTALVSNTNEIHHLSSGATVPALEYLSKHYVSYELRVMKPKSGFYEAVLRDLDLPAQEVVFIDDLPENIEGANRAGMHGILFRGVEGLRKDLRNFD